MKLRSRLVVLTLICLSVSMIPTLAAFPEGVGDMASRGCTCHGSGVDDGTVTKIHNLPENFTKNQTYILVFSVDSDVKVVNGAQGGFSLWYSAGSFELTEEIQLMDGRLTHTTSGNGKRVWVVNWSAPDWDDDQVDFQLHANAVNGDAETTGDQWDTYTISVRGTNQTGPLNDPSVPTIDEEIPAAGASSTLISIGFAAISLTLIRQRNSIDKFDISRS